MGTKSDPGTTVCLKLFSIPDVGIQLSRIGLYKCLTSLLVNRIILPLILPKKRVLLAYPIEIANNASRVMTQFSSPIQSVCTNVHILVIDSFHEL